MPYIGNSQNKSAAYAAERELLLAGFSYEEIARKTGERIKTISERNRLIHHVNIWTAFARRIQPEGIPSRMPDNDPTNAWFVGLVDGEGSFIVFTRPCTGRPQYTEFRLGLRVQLRADDMETLNIVQSHLGIGTLYRLPARNRSNPAVAWRCEKVQDLAEVLVPLFDRFPLRTKKAKEFIIWRQLVIRRYIDTLGGRSNRNGVQEDYKNLFEEAIKTFHEIRTFPI